MLLFTVFPLAWMGHQRAWQGPSDLNILQTRQIEPMQLTRFCELESSQFFHARQT